MKKRDKNRKNADRYDQKELERLVSGTGLKGSARDMAAQYGRGMLDGMHIAYRAVAERLLRAGNTREEIVSFFSDLLEKNDIERILEEAQQKSTGDPN